MAGRETAGCGKFRQRRENTQPHHKINETLHAGVRPVWRAILGGSASGEGYRVKGVCFYYKGSLIPGVHLRYGSVCTQQKKGNPVGPVRRATKSRPGKKVLDLANRLPPFATCLYGFFWLTLELWQKSNADNTTSCVLLLSAACAEKKRRAWLAEGKSEISIPEAPSLVLYHHIIHQVNNNVIINSGSSYDKRTDTRNTLPTTAVVCFSCLSCTVRRAQIRPSLPSCIVSTHAHFQDVHDRTRIGKDGGRTINYRRTTVEHSIQALWVRVSVTYPPFLFLRDRLAPPQNVTAAVLFFSADVKRSQGVSS